MIKPTLKTESLTPFHTSLPGGKRALEPPDPIPNSEVKRCIADGSVGLPHVRVGHCRASNPDPDLHSRSGFFFARRNRSQLPVVPPGPEFGRVRKRIDSFMIGMRRLRLHALWLAQPFGPLREGPGPDWPVHVMAGAIRFRELCTQDVPLSAS